MRKWKHAYYSGILCVFLATALVSTQKGERIISLPHNRKNWKSTVRPLQIFDGNSMTSGWDHCLELEQLRGMVSFSWIVFSDSLDQQFSVRAECEFINFEFFSSSRFPYFKHSERAKQSATLQLAAIYWMSLRLRLDSLAGCSSMSVVNSILNAGSLFLN